ncbi:hypothetical protein BVG79_01987 [Ketogulonicigenium robustum]|uniref:Uncharacterized protein n=1 Tax=Ketogulonicigenium robustum TaxID=92947 RepID=A0A1W6P1L6_9RHOB|nr:Mu transposase C-terminal domain-containing protein [Ketogulonicigenium robustum]ARO15329.1 hypothetical protein BVG79_01987 [Ketogulonicigenium robustum]
MSLKFKPFVVSGTKLTVHGRSHLLKPSTDGSFRAESMDGGDVEIWTLQEFLAKSAHQSASQSHIHSKSDEASRRIRDNGRFHKGQLTEKARDDLEFRKALCLGVEACVVRGTAVTAASLDEPKTKRAILEIARQYYTKRPIHLAPRGGGTREGAFLPCGRTLKLYWQRYIGSDYDDMALADQTWLRGNRQRRICWRTAELIRQAIEDVALDLKKPTAAAVHRRYKDLVLIENVKRRANELTELKVVSTRTISNEINAIGATALAIARDGERVATNNRTRGRTDTPALMVGELVEVDECKLSILAIVRHLGIWQRLSLEQREMLEELDDYVKTRLFLVLALDVATRMPLGWVLTDAPNREATMQTLRMAMRSKEREKVIYDCVCDPMPPVGIACVTVDNGPGVRNGKVATALLGANSQFISVRAYHSGDKPYVERFFGSMEGRLLNLLHGYTGRRAGHLKGYDASRSATFVRDELYAMVTKYLVDDYPNEIHHGDTFLRQKPIEAARRLAEEGWAISTISPQDLRLHFGWKRNATITDEGVKVFGLPYNSPELQRHRDGPHRKVEVYINPDCINDVTVLVQDCPDYIHADLSWTQMRDMSLAEFLAVAEAVRAADPYKNTDFDLALAKMRDEQFRYLRKLAIERDIPRSYMTIEEAQAKADRLTTGMHAYKPAVTVGTVAPGNLSNPAFWGMEQNGAADFGRNIDEGRALAQSDPADPVFVRPHIDGKFE